ncbi:MAG: hypothetical protein ABF649_04240 [Bacillus sp. (in: firmicutes)]
MLTNLVAPETEPSYEIREKYNLLGLEVEENPMGITIESTHWVMEKAIIS